MELELARRAMRYRLFTGFLILVAFAVRKETDLVKVFELRGFNFALEGVEEFLGRVGGYAVGNLVGERVRVCGYVSCVGLEE
jgi:hypothetical protein